MKGLKITLDAGWKTMVWVGLAAAVLIGCSQSTAPAREDTACRSGYNVSSGRRCDGE